MSIGGPETGAGCLLRAWLIGDDTATTDLLDRHGAGSAAVVGSAFELAVRRRFSADLDPREVTRYIRDLRAGRDSEDDELNPLIAEAVIRAVVGEYHLLRGLSQDDISHSIFVLLRELVRECYPGPENIDTLIAEAERVVVANSELLFGYGPSWRAAHGIQ